MIHDAYPKSTIHVLLLPRDPSKTLLHPFVALADPAFLADVQAKVREVRALVAGELRRRFGHLSALERARTVALEARMAGELEEEGQGEGEETRRQLPPGRDWEKGVISGVHAGPSMRHLHVHVLSVDRVSEWVRHRKHYNSFATPFLVDVEEFPLAEGDVRRHPGREGYLRRELRCWRCGVGFGNRFGKLKEHLEVEFKEWVKE